MYHVYRPYIGRKIFDVGAGMGRMVQYYLDKCEIAVATDIFQSQVDFMKERFRRNSCFEAILFDILRDDISPYEGRFDTVLCINVLEHLEDDKLAVERMTKLLSMGGHLILFVPAIKKLYSWMDRNVSHYRRYDKGELRALGESCGLKVVHNIYFNMMGIVPYYLKGKSKARDGSFSTSLNERNSKLLNTASSVLEPIERIVSPPIGLSEVIILKND